ncbi:hypothetical protein D3C80_1299370 [compost metagenome]
MQQLALERLVEGFELTLGLRVVGTAVADRDAQAHQPDLQGGQATLDIRAPGRPVVGGDALGQAVAAEHLDQPRADQFQALAFTRRQAQGEAGMIIQDRQRVATR